MESAPKKKEETKSNKFDWADEGCPLWCALLFYRGPQQFSH